MNAKSPSRATDGSAGLDLYSPTTVCLKAKERLSIDLEFQIQLPKGTFGLLKERSSFGKNFGIIVAGGVIDEDYRGNIEITLCNLSDADFQIEQNMKIGQIIIIKHKVISFVKTKHLKKTERGEKGHGSSGMF